MKPGVIDLLQLLPLQTRYEMACGHTAVALRQVRKKLSLIELLPAAECGALHVLLSIAARRQKRPELASWLMRRAELLCTPQQYAALTAANSDGGVLSDRES